MPDLIQGEIRSNLHALDAAMQQLAEVFPHKSADEIVTQQSRLFARDVIRLTPPFSLSEGREAVKRDIGKAVMLLEESDFYSPRIRSAIRSKDTQTIVEVFKHTQGIGDQFKRLTTQTTNLRASHWNKRDRRGRVRSGKTTEFTLDGPAYRRYIRDIQENVGLAKGGWAGAFIALGGKPSRWIARHRDAGYMQDGRGKKGQGSFVYFANRSPWATDKESARIRDAAMQTRERNIVAYSEHVLQGQLNAIEKQLQRAALRRHN